MIRGIAYDGPEKAVKNEARHARVIAEARPDVAVQNRAACASRDASFVLRTLRGNDGLTSRHLHGLASLTSNLPSAPEMTKSL